MVEVRVTNEELMVWWPPRQDEPVGRAFLSRTPVVKEPVAGIQKGT